MYRLFVFLCLISTINSYKIKVEGQVDMGPELAEIFKNLLDQVTFDNVQFDDQSSGSQIRKESVKQILPRDDKESPEPMMEKLLNGLQNTLHVYGSHVEKKRRPNNVNV